MSRGVIRETVDVEECGSRETVDIQCVTRETVDVQCVTRETVDVQCVTRETVDVRVHQISLSFSLSC